MIIKEIIGLLFIGSATYLIISGTILGIVWIKTYKIINPQSSYFKLALNKIQYIKDFFFGLEPENAPREIHELLSRYKKLRVHCLVSIGLVFILMFLLVWLSL